MGWVWAIKYVTPRDSNPMRKVDGTDLIKILQSKFSSARHLIIMNRCRNYYHNINEKTTFKKLKANLGEIIETLICLPVYTYNKK